MQKITNPVPLFVDARGTLIDAGKIFIGIKDGDPETDPLPVYWDSDLTIEAEQPLRTVGGYIVNGTTPAAVYVASDDYSMRLRDAFDVQVFYTPSLFVSGVQYQPLNAYLTTISGQGNKSYGLSLLTLPNQAALRDAVGYPAPLPLVGGTVTGDIKRQGAGTYFYGVNGLTSCRIGDPLPIGSTNPLTSPGDLQGFY